MYIQISYLQSMSVTCQILLGLNKHDKSCLTFGVTLQAPPTSAR